jgi:putative transposase
VRKIVHRETSVVEVYFQNMKLVAQLKLCPTKEQARFLKETLELANAACNRISEVAWKQKTFGKYALQKLCYRDVRSGFGLSAQMVVRCLAKVGDAYRPDKRSKRRFKRHGSIAYDDRILSWNLHEPSVSIWTVAGEAGSYARQRIPFVAGERQMKLLETRLGQTDLVYRRGKFYLLATCEVEDPEPLAAEGVIGVDLGVNNIAVDSDGNVRSGRTVNSVRHRHRRLRRKLQNKRTHSAKRRLKKLSGKEQRFARDTNHVISKEIVELAERTKRAIALEDLTGIRLRVRARRHRRARLSSWSFGQLRSFIEYKAKRAGVSVLFIDPRNTSRECPECGHISKYNRPSQAIFECARCGYAAHADSIAARNIAGRAAVMLPNVPETENATRMLSVLPGTSPPLQRMGS